MKLYLVHCGFYDPDIGDGLYEAHTNLFVAATDFDHARHQAKKLPSFKAKKMHVDGIQEVQAVDGYRLVLAEDNTLDGATNLVTNRHRDLAPKQPTSP